ncbi:hypothetical protein DID76_00170 [Candidatus Marinamargulisbacteria bacterium SCGC AG-414-C22]|nr:hypothetical protein DID76_00170 [Candidatus Marinamargulisbacteria bacterium SCGC AG-414-C22]
MNIKNMFFVMFFLVITSHLFAQEELLKISVTQNQEVQINVSENLKEKEDENLANELAEFNTIIEDLTRSLTESNYQQSLLILNDIKAKIYTLQKRAIATYFQNSFEDFNQTPHSEDMDIDILSDNSYGVLFNRNFSNSKGHRIDINVVHSDPAIEEYLQVINHPKLLNGLKDTHISNVQGYKSLVSMTSGNDTNHFEQNIILNSNLLVTVIYIGDQDEAFIETFVNGIDLLGLANYLD